MHTHYRDQRVHATADGPNAGPLREILAGGDGWTLDLPAHLRDDAPRQKCSSCGRYTYAVDSFGGMCNMPQPSRENCPGVFGPEES